MCRFLKTILLRKNLPVHLSLIKLQLFAVFLFSIFSLVFLVTSTNQRIPKYEHLVKIHQNAEETEIILQTAQENSSTTPSLLSVAEETEKTSESNIWCEVRDYEDLSSHQSIVLFQQWIDDFNELSCLHNFKIEESNSCVTHDPRVLAKMLKVGEKLAKERKPIFSKIIRGDPEKAITLAVSPATLNRLPESISHHLEKWESEFIDILALNVCYDPIHSNLVVRRAEFRDERKFRLWSYGNRDKLTTKKGVAAWGVSLGDDFAMSDQPYRAVETINGTGSIKIGDLSIAYTNDAEKDWITHRLNKAERRGHLGFGDMNYPVVMGSDGATIIQDKYKMRPAATFADAYQDALDQNGSLLVIEDEEEQKEVLLYIRSKIDVNTSRTLASSGDTNQSLVWLGLTDDNETNGSKYSAENGSIPLEINATEGNWTWMNGNLLVNGFQNWRLGYPSNATADHNFAAMEWNETNVTDFKGNNDANGTWIDVNATDLELRYVIEFELPETESIQVNLQGFRKFLVIPARWMDETDQFTSRHDGGPNAGTNNPSTNYIGESINEEIQSDPFDAMTRFNLEETMDAVSEFYSRNTDRELVLTPVITSTVTLPYYKAFSKVADDDENDTIFDTDGNFTEYIPYNIDDEYGLIGKIAYGAKDLAAQESERWDIESPAFHGLAILRLVQNKITDKNYSSPPEVEIRGGAFINPETLEPHPHFKAAQAEVILNQDGHITNIQLLSPGEFYFPTDFGKGN